MQYVICYDIADDVRRNRLAGALLDFGRRIQESVFLAHLDDELFEKMRHRIQQTIDQNLDTVHVFVLCHACEGRVEAIGMAKMPIDKAFYII